MANKRELKKQIKYVCGDLAAECIFAMNFVEGIDTEKMSDVIFDIASLQTGTIQKVSFSFDKTKSEFSFAHEYNVAKAKYYKLAYKTLRNTFGQEVLNVVKAMNQLLPQAQKDANKEIFK